MIFSFFFNLRYNFFFYFLLFQFDIKNTLSDQLLENVRVQIEPSEGWRIVKEVPCPRLPYSETHSAYVILQYPEVLQLTVSK